VPPGRPVPARDRATHPVRRGGAREHGRPDRGRRGRERRRPAGTRARRWAAPPPVRIGPAIRGPPRGGRLRPRVRGGENVRGGVRGRTREAMVLGPCPDYYLTSRESITGDGVA